MDLADRVNKLELAVTSLSSLVFADWDESAHERGYHGRFGSGSKDGQDLNQMPSTAAGWSNRMQAVSSAVSAYSRQQGDTQDQYDHVNGQRGRYDPETEKMHSERLAEKLAVVADVPRQREAWIFGGFPGSGKSSALPEQLGIRPDETHAVVDCDRDKTWMAENGMVPEIPGTSPLEAASLIHAESQDITRDFQDALLAQGTNVVLDGTMSNPGRTEGQIRELVAAGYTINVGFASITADESIRRVEARWQSEQQAFMEGKNDVGGRIVPAHFIKDDAIDGPTRGQNQENFYRTSNDPRISRSVMIDTMGEPKEVSDSARNPNTYH